jgi:predicted dehydrogenase
MGHGCNPNIKDSWKLDPIRAGGGCLIDPGIHLLDLCQLMSKDKIKVRCGWSWNGFWKTGIEEECHFLLEADKFLINLQVSIVKWRSTFRIEINGDKGYGIIEGRNRSYGKQRYIFGERWGWQKGCSQVESEILVSEESGEDVFTREIESLLYDVKSTLRPCSGKEAMENMKLLEECRKSINL